jgi:hypothetical protein
MKHCFAALVKKPTKLLVENSNVIRGKLFSHLYPHSNQPRGAPMSEDRKFAILFAATLLAARRLIDLDPDKPNMAKGFFVDRAIEDAAFILERIDVRWPTIVNSFSAKEP